MNPREAERKQVAQLLSLWDTRLLTALGGGGLRRFSALPPEQREQVLLSLVRQPPAAAAGRLPGAAQGRAALLLHGPGPERRAQPGLGRDRLPGPARARSETRRRKALQPLDVERDTTLDCDVCVVGSGAGGGTAAGVLAAAGLDVVVLEAGDYYDDEDFDGGELEGYGAHVHVRRRRGDARPERRPAGRAAASAAARRSTTRPRSALPTTCARNGPSHGVPAFAADEYGASLDAVCERLGVNQEHNAPSAREQVLQRGLSELGWHADFMPRNVRGCDQGENCGYCGYGCRLGAKQSTVKTWLADAHAAGARILVDTRAEKVRRRGRRGARGGGAHADGHRVTVRARAVVAACGAIHTPALLRRSGPRERRTSASTCACTRRRSSGASSTRRCGPGRARCRRSTPTSTATSTAATASSTRPPRSTRACWSCSPPGAAAASTPG